MKRFVMFFKTKSDADLQKTLFENSNGLLPVPGSPGTFYHYTVKGPTKEAENKWRLDVTRTP